MEDGALAKGMNEVAKEAPGAHPKALKDFRKALEDPTIDAIAIATPDHWHVPMAILSMAAGKHVYLEKPCSHNPHEGDVLQKAIARYGRIVQMGNQKRSYPNLQAAVKEIREGVIGTAYHAKAWYNGTRASIGHGLAGPSRRPLITSFGKDRHRAGPSRTTSSPTTGIGFGIGGPASRATMACMRSISAGGRWAWIFPPR